MTRCKFRNCDKTDSTKQSLKWLDRLNEYLCRDEAIIKKKLFTNRDITDLINKQSDRLSVSFEIESRPCHCRLLADIG